MPKYYKKYIINKLGIARRKQKRQNLKCIVTKLSTLVGWKVKFTFLDASDFFCLRQVKGIFIYFLTNSFCRNLEVICTVPHARWFFLVTIQVEVDAVSGIQVSRSTQSTHIDTQTHTNTRTHTYTHRIISRTTFKIHWRILAGIGRGFAQNRWVIYKGKLGNMIEENTWMCVLYDEFLTRKCRCDPLFRNPGYANAKIMRVFRHMPTSVTLFP